MSEKRDTANPAYGIVTNQEPVLTDPTALTTDALRREVAAVRELFETQLECLRESQVSGHKIIETRLDGMAEAVKLLQDTADKFPARIDEKITGLRLVHEEKFSSVDGRFSERDTRADKFAELNQKALDAALLTAEKAVGKTETSFTKQLDSLADRINEIKGRLDRGEGQDTGGQNVWGYVGIIVGVLIGVAGILVATLKR